MGLDALPLGRCVGEAVVSGVQDRRSKEAEELLLEWKTAHDDPDEDPPVDELYHWAMRAADLLEEMFGDA